MPSKTQNLPVASSLCLHRLVSRSFFLLGSKNLEQLVNREHKLV